MSRIYDEIGVGYSSTRRPDPRIAATIERALGDAASIVNVGAGAGSYEPSDRKVFAVEPSATMLSQRPEGSAPAVRAEAERLPLLDGAVDAALAILTIHHWSDPAGGLAELRRVARRRVVILTWDREIFERFWLVRDYLPCIRDFDRPRAVEIDHVLSALGGGEVITLPIPHDCVDGFLGAFWRRPAAYLDSAVRAAISAFAALPAGASDEGLRRLENDVRDGAWEEQHRDLLDLQELDLGYRLIVA
jgi:SAM-dependent methyltransferase